MNLETLLQNLIDALNANTAALLGSNKYVPPPIGAAVAPAPPVAAPAPTEPAPAPAAKGKPGPKPAKAAVEPASAVDLTAARAALTKVMNEKGSNEVRDILARVGAAKLSEVAADKVQEVLNLANNALAGTPAAAPQPQPSMFD